MSKNTVYLVIFLALLGGFVVLRENGQRAASSLVAEATNGNFSNWREYTSTYHHFKVHMPTLPQHANDKVMDQKTGETRRYDTFVSADSNGQAYMVTVITFAKPISKENIEPLLKDTISEMVSRNKDNKLVSVEADNFKTFKALKFTVSNGQLYMIGEAFVRDNSLFIVSILTKTLNTDSEELKFFSDSFDTILQEAESKENKS